MKILIAEDQQMARLVLANHLRQWGHQVIETNNGTEALEYAVQSRGDIDMLITDWSMPHMDGVELSRCVRALSAESQYIYIILLTGHGELKDMVHGFTEGGVDDYIVKPFDEAALHQRIQVAQRVIQAERRLRLYNQGLETIVQRQTEAIRATQMEIVSRLFSALESRDHETGSHVRRIGIMSAHLGELLGWPTDKINAIRVASPLHDIGKIGIPDNVLLKPGMLTRDEFIIIQRHTTIGAHILSNSHDPVIQMAETIAKSHHENWDGSGYPQGLHGEQIPDIARVVSIVDVYDALLDDRIYRKGMSQEEALEIIQNECGRKFDPTICKIFLDNVDSIRARSAEDAIQNKDYLSTSFLELFPIDESKKK